MSRCFCECHSYPGVYPPPCGVCGHDTRQGHMVGGYREGWEPNTDPRDVEVARLRERVAALEAIADAYRAWEDALDDWDGHYQTGAAHADRVDRLRKAARAALAGPGGEG